MNNCITILNIFLIYFLNLVFIFNVYIHIYVIYKKDYTYRSLYILIDKNANHSYFIIHISYFSLLFRFVYISHLTNRNPQESVQRNPMEMCHRVTTGCIV